MIWISPEEGRDFVSCNCLNFLNTGWITQITELGTQKVQLKYALEGKEAETNSLTQNIADTKHLQAWLSLTKCNYTFKN